MVVHQLHNSIGADVYNAFLYYGIEYPFHFHKGMEFVYVVCGQLNSTINGVEYTVNAGESLLIFPFSAHSYKASKNTEFIIVVFSESYVEEFIKQKNNLKPISNLFKLSKITSLYILNALGYYSKNDLLAYNGYPYAEKIIPLSLINSITAKSYLYAICSEFDKTATYVKSINNKNSLLLNSLIYIETNFKKDITLKTLANYLGYDYEYTSREFNREMKLNFKTLVNQYRCDYATTLLSKQNKTVTEVAFESGFQSVRSFNRVFKTITGKTPKEYTL